MNEYSLVMKEIRNKVIKENIKTTPLRMDYDLRICPKTGNIIIEQKP